jgi:uncharacterized protein YjiS (DUF1127 family)
MAVNPTVDRASGPFFVRRDTATNSSQTRVLTSVRAVLGRWRRLSATRRELSRLDERTLRDIGFDPEEVRRETEKSFWKPYTLAPTSE